MSKFGRLDRRGGGPKPGLDECTGMDTGKAGWFGVFCSLSCSGHGEYTGPQSVEGRLREQTGIDQPILCWFDWIDPGTRFGIFPFMIMQFAR